MSVWIYYLIGTVVSIEIFNISEAPMIEYLSGKSDLGVIFSESFTIRGIPFFGRD
jgi:hypothetical protein